MRPEATCMLRDSTREPDIMVRAPMETAGFAAGATAARAVTRARRATTGARATMGVEMAIAAILTVPCVCTSECDDVRSFALFGGRRLKAQAGKFMKRRVQSQNDRFGRAHQ